MINNLKSKILKTIGEQITSARCNINKTFLVVIVLGLLSFNTNAQMSTYKGQALFIYNFTKHFNWQSSGSTFVIGVIGKTELTEELNAVLKGKIVSGMPVIVKVFDSAEEARQCQILYVASSKSAELASLTSNIKNMLIITEDDLIKKGAGISFVMIDAKLRFKISENALSKSGLQVSGGLLTLAVRS